MFTEQQFGRFGH